MPTALFPLTGQSIGTANLFRSVFHGSRITSHESPFFILPYVLTSMPQKRRRPLRPEWGSWGNGAPG
jgi:hypothetical protein